MFSHHHHKACDCARFYLLQDDFQVPYLNEQQSQGIAWDPWPVRQHEGDNLLKAARLLLTIRNAISLDHGIDSITILPASGSRDGVQGGSSNRQLYSIRSPSMLPFKVHIWKTQSETLIVRHGLRLDQLSNFLEHLGCYKWREPGANLTFWESLQSPEDLLLKAPFLKYLQRELRLEWTKVNVFRFLDLPPELRELIMCFAVNTCVVSPKQCKFPMAIVTPRVSHVWPRHRQFPTLDEGKYRDRKPAINLLLVNKQIYQESLSTLFANTTIRFGDPALLQRFLKCDTLARVLRYLRVLLSAYDLLGLFGVRSGRRKQYEFYSSAGFALRCQQDAGNIALQGLSIFFPCFEPNIESCECKDCFNDIAMKNLSRNYCQYAYCEDVLIGTRGFLVGAGAVQLFGKISEEQIEKWRKIIQTDRQTGGLDPETLSAWQRETWKQK